MEPVELGVKYRPSASWVGFQIPAQYPYSDIYPVFIGGDVVRADGVAFQAPVTPGYNFEGRAALQISAAAQCRRSKRLAESGRKDSKSAGFSGEALMTDKCRLRISREDFDLVYRHLFPGDLDEHGVVLLAGMSSSGGQITLHVREVHIAREGIDYVEGKVGYRALTPTFIHRLITRARDERLVYLAAHNHGSDRDVAFSRIDLESHQRGYPALLQIAKGMPVGAMVFGHRSVEVDLWLPSGQRLGLEEAVIVGNTIHRLMPSPKLQFVFKVRTTMTVRSECLDKPVKQNLQRMPRRDHRTWRHRKLSAGRVSRPARRRAFLPYRR